MSFEVGVWCFVVFGEDGFDLCNARVCYQHGGRFGSLVEFGVYGYFERVFDHDQLGLHW